MTLTEFGFLISLLLNCYLVFSLHKKENELDESELRYYRAIELAKEATNKYLETLIAFSGLPNPKQDDCASEQSDASAEPPKSI